METDRNISLYRVGMLKALHMDWRAIAITHATCRPYYTWQFLKLIATKIRCPDCSWRSIRMQFNGWHAEHAYAGTRVGHGWTKRRALADLRRHLDSLDKRRD